MWQTKNLEAATRSGSQATREKLCCGRYWDRMENTDASLTAGLWPLGGDVASQLVWHCHKACGIATKRVANGARRFFS